MEADMENLAAAVGRRDGASVRNTAHRLKGAARFLGGFQLAAAGEALEESATKMSWSEIDVYWPALVGASKDIAREIQGRQTNVEPRGRRQHERSA
jgi:HPt (histidine-containing phosphotransfer) domain-containing protein